MTDKLKAAIITIAEYDGWKRCLLFGIDSYERKIKGINQMVSTCEQFLYSTDANELLRVWKNLRTEAFEKGYVMASTFSMSITMNIIDLDLPAACELIADIIHQLKQKP